MICCEAHCCSWYRFTITIALKIFCEKGPWLARCHHSVLLKDMSEHLATVIKMIVYPIWDIYPNLHIYRNKRNQISAMLADSQCIVGNILQVSTQIFPHYYCAIWGQYPGILPSMHRESTNMADIWFRLLGMISPRYQGICVSYVHIRMLTVCGRDTDSIGTSILHL